MSQSDQLSALREQKLLRRAEARIASAARAVQNLEHMGEALARTMGAENDPLVKEMRREYEAMLAHMEALALSAGKLHIAAQELCQERNAEIIHARGEPKENPVEIADWILTGGLKREPQAS